MKKNLILSTIALLLSFAGFAQTPITGVLGCCAGSTSWLFDSSATRGTWYSSDTTIATIDSSTGLTTGVSAGTATITYSYGSGYVTASFTVSAAPPAIGGVPSALCVGSTATLTNSVSGGTWSASPASIATINTSTGVLTGVGAGSATVLYTVGTGCSATAIISVPGSVLPDSIVGPSTVCVGSSGSFTITSAGGTWSSSNTSIATVNPSTGTLYGVAVGTINLSYTVTTACGTLVTFVPVVISSTSSAGTISGPSSGYMSAGSYTFTSSATGGTWTCSPSSVAVIDASTGVLTPVATGTCTITYSVTGCGGSTSTTTTFTVTPFTGISGTINFSSGVCYGYVKVWLITYNSSTSLLQAVDSLYLSVAGSSLPYQFPTAATDTYRVKAAVIDTSRTTTGYIPTYHDTSYYWYNANIIPHVSGTADINKDINMAYGTVTAGPGFIGGNVTSGANKGTTGGTPVVGMTIFIVNTTTNTIIAKTTTDAAGSYSFSNLPVGNTYMIFPEELSYRTTAFVGINLTTSRTTMNGISFIKHTVSKTITPILEGISTTENNEPAIGIFPNPASNKLNIQWNENNTEAGTISITDFTGSEVYRSSVVLNAGAGSTNINVSTLTNGMYLLHVHTNTTNYTTKVTVQH